MYQSETRLSTYRRLLPHRNYRRDEMKESYQQAHNGSDVYVPCATIRGAAMQ